MDEQQEWSGEGADGSDEEPRAAARARKRKLGATGAAVPISHLEMEQRRRDNMNAGFEELRALVPHERKRGKAVFLKEVCAYVRKLQRLVAAAGEPRTPAGGPDAPSASALFGQHGAGTSRSLSGSDNTAAAAPPPPANNLAALAAFAAAEAPAAAEPPVPPAAALALLLPPQVAPAAAAAAAAHAVAAASARGLHGLHAALGVSAEMAARGVGEAGLTPGALMAQQQRGLKLMAALQAHQAAEQAQLAAMLAVPPRPLSHAAQLAEHVQALVTLASEAATAGLNGGPTLPPAASVLLVNMLMAVQTALPAAMAAA